MITATFFIKKINDEAVYGLFLHDGDRDMIVHCGHNLESAMIFYEEITEKPSITDDLLAMLTNNY